MLTVAGRVSCNALRIQLQADFLSSWRVSLHGVPPDTDFLEVSTGQVLTAFAVPRDVLEYRAQMPSDTVSAAATSHEDSGRGDTTVTVPASGATGDADSGHIVATVDDAGDDAVADSQRHEPWHGHLASFGYISASFLVLGQNYLAEHVEVRLPVGLTVATALQHVAAARAPEHFRLLPRLCAVCPQPKGTHALVLSLPAWDLDCPLVAFDCRAVNGALFALQLIGLVSRADLLRAAQLEADLDVDVYVGAQPWPLPEAANVRLFLGDLVLIVPRGARQHVVSDLQDMLQSAAGWSADFDPANEVQGPIHHFSWIIGWDSSFHFRIQPDRRRQVRHDIAQGLGVLPGDFSLCPARIESSDFAHRGQYARTVLAACRRGDLDTIAGVQQALCFIDARPLLLRLLPRICPAGVLDTNLLLQIFAHPCPDGWVVCIIRDHVEHRVIGQQISVNEGDVFAVVFRPPSEEIANPTPPPTPPDDSDSSDDEGHRPSRAQSSVSAPSSSSTPAIYLADTGGTSAHSLGQSPSPSGCTMWLARFLQLAVLAGTWLVTPVTAGFFGQGSAIVQHLRVVARPRGFGSSLAIAAFTLLLFAQPADGVQIVGVGLSLPHGSENAPTVPDDLLGPLESRHLSCAPEVHTARPLPTPCRAFNVGSKVCTPLDSHVTLERLEAQHRQHTDPTAQAFCRFLPCEVAAAEQPGQLVTLLEQSLSNPETQAMFLAATLVETLFEHFGCGAPAAGSRDRHGDGSPASVGSSVLHDSRTCDPSKQETAIQSLSLLATVPVTAFQQECLDLTDTIPVSAALSVTDWLDNELCSLLRDTHIPLHIRTLFVNICRWHEMGEPTISSLAVYSDGSASGSHADCRPCAWAFTVWAHCDGAQFLVGYAAAQAAPEGSPYYLGESTQCALTGELLGLCWSLAWIVEFAARFGVPVQHFYDAKGAGEGVFGCCTVPQAAHSPYRALFFSCLLFATTCSHQGSALSLVCFRTFGSSWQ